MQLSNELLIVGAIALVLIVVLVLLIPAANKRGHGDEPAPSGDMHEDYPDKQVKVTVEWQGFPVRVQRLPYAPLEETRSDQDEFQPLTPLLNIVVARDDDSELLVTRFDPPLRLEFTYSMDVLRRAKEMNLDVPLYGFWDGCKWVKFTLEKHQLSHELPTDTTDGHASVQLVNWSDPIIGRVP